MTFTSTYDFFQIGSETSLSQTVGFQRGANLIALGNGTSAVFYYDLASSEIAARLVAADGTPGTRIVASSGSIDFQDTSAAHREQVSVARLTNGNIVLTWASNEATKNVYYRIFDANLNPLTGAVIAETRPEAALRPDVAALSGGGFVIVFELKASANDSDPFFRRFDANGTALDATAVRLDLSVSIDESPSVAGLADGGFAVGWHRRDSASSDTAIHYAVRNADGSTRVASTLLDAVGTLNRDVDVVARNDGGFSLLYEDSGWGGDTEITAANFNAAGAFQQYRRMTDDANSSSDAATAVSSEGFVLVTQTSSYANFPDITGSLMAPDGTVLRTDIALATVGENQVSGLAWLDAATVRIAYQGYGVGLGDDGLSVNSRTYRLFRFTNGDAANDIIDFSTSAVGNEIHGGDGDDVITGGPITDFLNGDNNNDTLNGGAGNDFLDGGFGINVLNGGTGNDELRISASGSSVHGDADFDTLSVYNTVSVAALSGVEAINLVNANLTLTGTQFSTGLVSSTLLFGTGTLTVNMSAGLLFSSKTFTNASGIVVVVNGTLGNDVFKLGNFAHTVNAGDGIDSIKGGTAVDTLNGGSGIDKINGAGGADVLTGGLGNDVFKYANASDSGLGATRDRITDYAIGADRLNFGRIDTNAGLAGDQGFVFVSTGAFSAGSVASIRYANSGADLLVQADVDGNGTADMEIILQGLSGGTLTAADFVL